VDAYEAAMLRCGKDAAQADALGGDALKALKDLEGKVSMPELRIPVQALLRDHAELLQREKKWAQTRAALIGKRAPNWSGKDLAGGIHGDSDGVGKVVVLDFWYRGCISCARGLVQCQQLAEAFRDKRVLVVGVNADKDPGDAKYAREKLGLGFLTLCDGVKGNIAARDGVHSFPTLVIIDRQGVVRAFYFGWTAQQKDDVVEQVKKLLEEGAR